MKLFQNIKIADLIPNPGILMKNILFDITTTSIYHFYHHTLLSGYDWNVPTSARSLSHLFSLSLHLSFFTLSFIIIHHYMLLFIFFIIIL